MGEAMSETWHVWTDGSCVHGLHNVPKGVLGWGGWAAVVEHGMDGFVVRGREPHTTNVKMELVAAIEGLKATPLGASVKLHTDSTTILCVRDWALDKRTNTGADAKLWKALTRQLERRNVRMHLIVKGEREPQHQRAHAIAGAEAKGGLKNLPVNAAPIPEAETRRLHRDRRKQLSTGRKVLQHTPACIPGYCMYECPVWLAGGDRLSA